MSVVTIVMGSKSDLASLQGAFDTLKQFGVPFRARILSAHRTPDEAADLAKNAAAEGTKIFICAAGMAAHLAGAVAAKTVRPVIGIPISGTAFGGMDRSEEHTS